MKKNNLIKRFFNFISDLFTGKIKIIITRKKSVNSSTNNKIDEKLDLSKTNVVRMKRLMGEEKVLTPEQKQVILEKDRIAGAKQINRSKIRRFQPMFYDPLVVEEHNVIDKNKNQRTLAEVIAYENLLTNNEFKQERDNPRIISSRHVINRDFKKEMP
jgi:hypothetical protein